MDIRSEIVHQFSQVAREQGRRLSPLSDDLELLESGLDSLSMAILVVRLEESLGIDPFTLTDDARFPITFGEFVDFYETSSRQSQ
ncbi:acyl carrier protein [Acidipila rosea]|uniref:Phosphopantetheine binding protein n=1 Tax=Acidipila rosea TaxID=768535 RepID=A0A4R1KXT6_9BACT|nr:phosphopantetheine binding protein [Acidipila rosea]